MCQQTREAAVQQFCISKKQTTEIESAGAKKTQDVNSGWMACWQRCKEMLWANPGACTYADIASIEFTKALEVSIEQPCMARPHLISSCMRRTALSTASWFIQKQPSVLILRMAQGIVLIWSDQRVLKEAMSVLQEVYDEALVGYRSEMNS